MQHVFNLYHIYSPVNDRKAQQLEAMAATSLPSRGLTARNSDRTDGFDEVHVYF